MQDYNILCVTNFFFLTSKQLFFVLCSYLSSVHVLAVFRHPSTSSWEPLGGVGLFGAESDLWKCQGIRSGNLLYVWNKNALRRNRCLLEGGVGFSFSRKYVWNLKLCCLFAFCFLKVEPNPLSDLRISWSCSLPYSKDLALLHFSLHDRKLERAGGLCLAKVHFALCSHSRPKTAAKEKKGNIKIKGALSVQFVAWVLRM